VLVFGLVTLLTRIAAVIVSRPCREAAAADL